MTERRADDASRDVMQWLKCYYMQDKVGETFAGTISGVTSFGIFVTLDGLNIDGLVHVTELRQRLFPLRRRAPCADRRAQRPRIPAGRARRVKVARVDLEHAKIDFTLDEAATDAEPQPLSPSVRRSPSRLRAAIGRAALRVQAPTIATAPSNGADTDATRSKKTRRG